MLNTLERLRNQQPQTQPPTARPGGPRGGAPNAGGSPDGSDTSNLTAGQRGAIGDHVRACWTADTAALNADRQVALLTVTTDANGVVRRAMVADEDRGKMSDPRFRAFAERAVRAVMDPKCANLPLPPSMLGQTRTWDFRFRP